MNLAEVGWSGRYKKGRKGAGLELSLCKHTHTQREREREMAARPGRQRGPVRRWEKEEVLAFCRLLLDYFGRCGHLPENYNDIFWGFCHGRLNGAFTPAQLRQKMRHLKHRHEQLASGQAKHVKPSERETFQIWSQMMITANPPTATVVDDGANTSTWQHSQKPAVATNVSSPSGGCIKGKHGMAGVRENSAKGKPCAPYAENATAGETTAGDANLAGEGGVEEQQEASTCSTEYGHSYGHGEHDHRRGNKYGEQDEATATPDDDGYFHQNLVLLHHITIADLAAAIKKLAEVVQAHPMN